MKKTVAVKSSTRKLTGRRAISYNDDSADRMVFAPAHVDSPNARVPVSSSCTYTNPHPTRPISIAEGKMFTYTTPVPSSGAGRTENRRHSRPHHHSWKGKKESYYNPEQTYHDKRRKPNNRVIVLAILFLLGGIAGLMFYLWPILFGENECTNLELPPEYRAVICARIQTGKTCDFNVESCNIECPLGLETDEFACITSCNCATEGLFEADVAYNEESLQTLLSAYMTVEDHSFTLFSGSATNVLNIWNMDKVGSSIRVPYVLAENLDTNVLAGINAAISQLLNQTCVELVVRIDEPDYIVFKDGLGCSSSVSKIGGEQHIILSKDCSDVGAVLHEIIHSLGFWHEHSRPDRNEHVRVLWENIDQSDRHHFNTRSIETVFDFGSPYDVSSVMHGSGFSYSIDFSKPAMIDLNTSEPVKIQRKGLSIEDTEEINSLYECYIPDEESFFGAHWGEWSEEGQCSVTCGNGVAYQIRECLDEKQFIISRKFCGSDYHLEKSCHLEPCEEGVWGPWSPCDHTCGLGIRRRTSCCGKNTTTEMEDCEVEECTDPASAFWAGWQEWGECLRTCGNGMKRRYRSCFDLFELKIENLRCPQVGTAHLEIEICAADPCPEQINEIGSWSEWSHWSQCTRTCGVGSFKRVRECLTMNGTEAKYCIGDNIDIQPCNMTICQQSALSLWEPWGPWSDCSESCGGGRKVRYRKCQSSVPLTLETDCGESMELLDKESRIETCHNNPCDPVTTMWSEWESWGECDAECKGTQWRLRSCLGGKLGDPGCEWHAIYDMKTCNEDSCEQSEKSLNHAYQGSRWAAWTQWSSCTASCDGGRKRRFRLCETLHHVLTYDCVTKYNRSKSYIADSRKCNTLPCREMNTTWSGWEMWQPCTVTCGRGVHVRERICLLGPNKCDGSRMNSKDCEFTPCAIVVKEKENTDSKGVFEEKKLVRIFEGSGQTIKKKLVEGEKDVHVGKPWKSYATFCDTDSRLYLNDFNGDGKKDTMCLNSKGKIKISYAPATNGIQLNDWEADIEFCTWTLDLVYVADFNNDKTNDLLCFGKYTGSYTVLFSKNGKLDGTGGFIEGKVPADFCSSNSFILDVTDLNDDGKADLVCRGGKEDKVIYNRL